MSANKNKKQKLREKRSNDMHGPKESKRKEANESDDKKDKEYSMFIVKRLKNNEGKSVIVNKNKQEEEANNNVIKVSSSGKSNYSSFSFFSLRNFYKMKAFLLNFVLKDFFF